MPTTDWRYTMIFIPIPGEAMRILETTTWEMACCAAFVDSPNLLSFSSVTGMPCWSSLRTRSEDDLANSEKWSHNLWYQQHFWSHVLSRGSLNVLSLPLSHQWDIDTVSSSYSSKWNKSSKQGWDVLQREKGGTKTGGKEMKHNHNITWICLAQTFHTSDCRLLHVIFLILCMNYCISTINQHVLIAGRKTCWLQSMTLCIIRLFYDKVTVCAWLTPSSEVNTLKWDVEWG